MTDLVVLLAPPAPQRRRHQLPEFIPNGPWSSPPPDTDDAQPRRPINAALPRDRSVIWLRNAAIGLCGLAAAAAAVSFTAQYRMVYADRRMSRTSPEELVTTTLTDGTRPFAAGAPGSSRD